MGKQETCSEARTVTLHKTHKHNLNKKKVEKKQEKMEEENLLSRLACYLEVSSSPSPSSSPLFSDLAEGNFDPN